MSIDYEEIIVNIQVKQVMDFEFRTQQDHDRRSVEDLFEFQGRMIGRGTYGKVFKAKRKDGFDLCFFRLALIFLLIISVEVIQRNMH